MNDGIVIFICDCHENLDLGSFLCCNSIFLLKIFLKIGVFSTLRAVPKKEGYLGLYKGNGAMMIRIFPYGAIQFMAFEQYKTVLELLSFFFFSSFISLNSILSCQGICFGL